MIFKVSDNQCGRPLPSYCWASCCLSGGGTDTIFAAVD